MTAQTLPDDPNYCFVPGLRRRGPRCSRSASSSRACRLRADRARGTRPRGCAQRLCDKLNRRLGLTREQWTELAAKSMRAETHEPGDPASTDPQPRTRRSPLELVQNIAIFSDKRGSRHVRDREWPFERAIKQMPRGRPFTAARFLEHAPAGLPSTARTLSRWSARDPASRPRRLRIVPRTSRVRRHRRPRHPRGGRESSRAVQRRDDSECTAPKPRGGSGSSTQVPAAARFHTSRPAAPSRSAGVTVTMEPHLEPPPVDSRARRRAPSLRAVVSRQGQRDAGDGRHDRGRARPSELESMRCAMPAWMQTEAFAGAAPEPVPWLSRVAAPSAPASVPRVLRTGAARSRRSTRHPGADIWICWVLEARSPCPTFHPARGERLEGLRRHRPVLRGRGPPRLPGLRRRLAPLPKAPASTGTKRFAERLRTTSPADVRRCRRACPRRRRRGTCRRPDVCGRHCGPTPPGASQRGGAGRIRGSCGIRRASAEPPGRSPDFAARHGGVMSLESSLAPAVRYDAAATYAMWSTPAAPRRRPTRLLARIERAGPAALEDHELLGLLGLDVDAATLAAAGGLRELLDDPGDGLHAVPLPPGHRARVHALHEASTRGGWRPGFAATGGRSPRPPTPGATSRRAFAGATATRSSPASSSTAATASSRSRSCSGARSTAPPSSIRASSCAAALGHNAAALVCMHNHPSGVAEPSATDRAIGPGSAPNRRPPAQPRRRAATRAPAASEAPPLGDVRAVRARCVVRVSTNTRFEDMPGGTGGALSHVPPARRPRRGEAEPGAFECALIGGQWRASGPSPFAAHPGGVMPRDILDSHLCRALRSGRALCRGDCGPGCVRPPTLLARIGRAGPARTRRPRAPRPPRGRCRRGTLAASGGLRELLADPGDCRTLSRSCPRLQRAST